MEHDPPRLSVLSDYYGNAEPLADPLPAGIGHAPGPSAAGALPYDPHLARLFEMRTPIEKKFGVRFEFPAGQLKSDVIEKTLNLNAFEYVVVSYKWAWSGWSESRETPISVSYGTSTDEVLRRPALISAVWGSSRNWSYPARSKIYRKNRSLVFYAQIDHSLWGITDAAQVQGSILDVVMDGLELRDK